MRTLLFAASILVLVAVIATAAWSRSSEPAGAAGPGPGMSLSAPSTVAVGEKFSVEIETNPSPNIDFSGFMAEILVTSGLKYSGSNICSSEVKVTIFGNLPSLCLSSATPGGGQGISILSLIATVPPALDQSVPNTAGIALANLSYTCNVPGVHIVTLAAFPASQDGAAYAGVNGNLINVKSNPADTASITCTPPVPVGGLAVDLDGDQAGLPLEAAQSSDGNAGPLAALIAGITAGTVALAGAVWYARRRWLRERDGVR